MAMGAVEMMKEVTSAYHAYVLLGPSRTSNSTRISKNFAMIALTTAGNCKRTKKAMNTRFWYSVGEYPRCAKAPPATRPTTKLENRIPYAKAESLQTSLSWRLVTSTIWVNAFAENSDSSRESWLAGRCERSALIESISLRSSSRFGDSCQTRAQSLFLLFETTSSMYSATFASGAQDGPPCASK